MVESTQYNSIEELKDTLLSGTDVLSAEQQAAEINEILELKEVAQDNKDLLKFKLDKSKTALSNISEAEKFLDNKDARNHLFNNRDASLDPADFFDKLQKQIAEVINIKNQLYERIAAINEVLSTIPKTAEELTQEFLNFTDEEKAQAYAALYSQVSNLSNRLAELESRPVVVAEASKETVASEEGEEDPQKKLERHAAVLKKMDKMTRGMILFSPRKEAKQILGVGLKEAVGYLDNSLKDFTDKLSKEQQRVSLALLFAGAELGLWEEPGDDLLVNFRPDQEQSIRDLATDLLAIQREAKRLGRIHPNMKDIFKIYLMADIDGIADKTITKLTGGAKSGEAATATTGGSTATTEVTTEEGDEVVVSPSPEQKRKNDKEKTSPREKAKAELKNTIQQVQTEVDAYSDDEAKKAFADLHNEAPKGHKVFLLMLKNSIGSFLTTEESISLSLAPENVQHAVTMGLLIDKNDALYDEIKDEGVKSKVTKDDVKNIVTQLKAL